MDKWVKFVLLKSNGNVITGYSTEYSAIQQIKMISVNINWPQINLRCVVNTLISCAASQEDLVDVIRLSSQMPCFILSWNAIFSQLVTCLLTSCRDADSRDKCWTDSYPPQQSDYSAKGIPLFLRILEQLLTVILYTTLILHYIYSYLLDEKYRYIYLFTSSQTRISFAFRCITLPPGGHILTLHVSAGESRFIANLIRTTGVCVFYLYGYDAILIDFTTLAVLSELWSVTLLLIISAQWAVSWMKMTWSSSPWPPSWITESSFHGSIPPVINIEPIISWSLWLMRCFVELPPLM